MDTPHLTPEKLLHTITFPAHWKEAKIAFVCFTPFPNGFKKYVIETAVERYFLHSPNDEVKLCKFEELSFIVISEVYGFPVGATTVEELVYYGIEQIIGIGYVGAFNGAPIGQSIIGKNTLSDLPIAKHYGVNEFERVYPTNNIYKNLKNAIKIENKKWGDYSIWTSNSLYRETSSLVKKIKEANCDVVNMDALSIYSVGSVCNKEQENDIEFIYVGTVTDSANKEIEEHWESDLLEAVKRKEKHPHDDLVEFMVEKVMKNISIKE